MSDATHEVFNQPPVPAGSELAEQGRLANRYGPKLRIYDLYGHRIDSVEFHPTCHELMRCAIAHGVHSLAWEDEREGAHVVRAALEPLHHQADSDTDCPCCQWLRYR